MMRHLLYLKNEPFFVRDWLETFLFAIFVSVGADKKKDNGFLIGTLYNTDLTQ